VLRSVRRLNECIGLKSPIEVEDFGVARYPTTACKLPETIAAVSHPEAQTLPMMFTKRLQGGVRREDPKAFNSDLFEAMGMDRSADLESAIE
jgi:hypothetical protein